jgi:hypothetical protein
LSIEEGFMNGVVRSGSDRNPLANATVTLHHVSGGQSAEVARTTTSDSGSFSMAPVVASSGDHFYYAIADLGDGVVLMTILGASIPEYIVINELTTVAAAYSAAQLLNGTGIQASTLALNIVAAMNANLIDLSTGGASSVMTSSPNGDQTNACRSLMSLANFLTTAVRDHNKALADFFELTTLPGQPAPKNTVAGLANLARKPANHLGGIYAQSKLANVYGPVLTAQPLAWTIVVKVNDSGDNTRMFGGPGSLVFDTQGNAWIPNNVAQGTPNSSLYSIVLGLSGRPLRDPNGTLLSPFEGGGLVGAGLGVDVDSSGNVWIGDFGWGDQLPDGGVSKFAPDTTPISPAPNGYQNGGMQRVQGTIFDPSGNLWMAGWGNGTVVCYRGGNPDDYAVYGDSSGKFKPFCIAFAQDGSAWVTNSYDVSDVRNIVLGDGVSMDCVRTIPIGNVLKGIQIDSAGNIWLASGNDHHVYVLDANGNFVGGYQGGGTNGPWGIVLDGDENLWVGNFGPLEVGNIFHGRLTQLAGINANGYRLGDGLTPPTGYTLPSEGDQVLLADNNPLYGPGAPPSTIPMMRTTGLNIDAAGNVWTCNNWKPDFTSDAIDDPWTGGTGNPGGDGMLIWVGLAKPPS